MSHLRPTTNLGLLLGIFNCEGQLYNAVRLCAGDKSRAGGVDAPIADLVASLNSWPRIFTTSSCSGELRAKSSQNTKVREE